MMKKHSNLNKNEKNTILIIFICVLFLTVGYSSFSAELGINGISTIVRLQRDIRITEVNLVSVSGNGESQWEDYNVNNVYSQISLPNSNSTVTYNIKVSNLGNIEALIFAIDGLPNNLKYTISNYNLNDILCDDTDSTQCKLGSITTLTITIGYDTNGYDSSNTDYSIDMNFTFNYASSAVAMINSSLYNSLQAAVDDVPTDNTLTTIKLLNSTTEIITINRNKNIILDLNYRSLGNSGNNPVISNSGTLEIINGTINSNAATNGAVNNESTGVLTVSSGRIVATGGRQAIYNNKGRATITGSAYLSSTTSERATVQNLVDGTLTILGGTIVSTGSNAVQNAGTMVVGIQDGNINKNAPIMQGKDAGIYSTTNYSFYDGIAKGRTIGLNTAARATSVETGYSIISSEETINGVLYRTAYLGIGKTVTFNANGGSVTEPTRTVEINHKVGSLPIPTRHGYDFLGWFTARDGGTQISENTIITDNIPFYAHWLEIEEAAQIGDTIYASLSEALSHVPNNTQTTITVLNDITADISVSENKNVIIDLDGHTISNVANNRPIIVNAGTLSIINGTLTSTATQGAINNTAGNLTITDMRITTTARQTLYVTGGVVTITGNSYLSSDTQGTPTGITMERGAVQVVSGTLNVLGGTIVGTKQQAISNEGTVNIGTKDGNINASSPVLIGEVHGVRSTGTFNFYDGIIKGRTDATSGTITDQETNSQVVSGTETINNKIYQTAHLEINE